MTQTYLCAFAAAVAAVVPVFAQESAAADPAPANNNVARPLDAPRQSREAKRLFGVIPNFRTSEALHPYVPLSTKRKFHLATQDAFDRGTIALAAAFAGFDQLTNADKSYGQGVQGFAKYWGASYATYAIGDYMTEGIFPTLLHQDPRYFRMGEGSGWKRFGYAMGQILWTHSDTGRGQFNFSEVLGNSTAVAISQAYYPDHRDAKDAIGNLGTQLAVDAMANVLKEFWPEIDRKLSRKR